MSISILNLVLEKGRDGAYRAQTSDGVLVITGVNSKSKSASRSLVKIQVPYSYVGPDGGTVRDVQTVHLVDTGTANVVNTAHQVARDAATNRGADLLCATLVPSGSVTGETNNLAVMRTRLETGFDVVPEGFAGYAGA